MAVYNSEWFEEGMKKKEQARIKLDKHLELRLFELEKPNSGIKGGKKR